MQRIDAYNGLFQPGNPATNTKGTVVTAKWLNAVQEEIAAVIEEAGIKLDPDLTKQLATAIQSGKLVSTVAGGTPDAITAAFAPSVTALIDGMVLRVRASAANATATPTFAPGGLIPAKVIVKGDNKPLTKGDIAGAGHWLELQYDAALGKWVLLNPAQTDKKDDGVPLLMTIYSTTGIVEPGYLDISQDNGLLARAAFPDAWAKLQQVIAAGSGVVISETAWQAEKSANGGVCGKFSTGDGSTTFRVPLIGKRFIRATGAGLTAGTAQGDAIRNIKSQGNTTLLNDGTLPEPASNSGFVRSAGTATVYSAMTSVARYLGLDVSGIVPTADENRPVAVAYTPLLKMYGAVSDAGTLDIAALVQGLAAKLDASAAIGVGQSWQDVTASRVLATTYTNSTGRPITVNVAATSSATAAVVRLTIGGVVVSGSGGPAANNSMGVIAIVPNGSTYSATVSTGTGTLTSWSELR